MVGGCSNIIKENEQYQIMHSSNYFSDFDFDFDTRYLITNNPLSSSTVFFRNGIINFFPKVYYQTNGSDRRMYLLLSVHGKCRYFNKLWGVYRIHSGGVSQKSIGKNKIKGLENRLETIKHWDKYFDYKYKVESEQALRDYLKKLLFLYIKKKQLLKIIICILKLFKILKY